MEQIYLIEATAAEVRALEALPWHGELADFGADLADLQPHTGFVVEVPESAVEHTRVLMGNRRQLPIEVAIVGLEGGRRLSTAERAVEYVTQAIGGIKARVVTRHVRRELLAFASDLKALDDSADTTREGMDAAIERISLILAEATDQLSRIRW